MLFAGFSRNFLSVLLRFVEGFRTLQYKTQEGSSKIPEKMPYKTQANCASSQLIYFDNKIVLRIYSGVFLFPFFNKVEFFKGFSRFFSIGNKVI
jgi:hypothetical protein